VDEEGGDELGRFASISTGWLRARRWWTWSLGGLGLWVFWGDEILLGFGEEENLRG
jgi:hypothetical protein